MTTCSLRSGLVSVTFRKLPPAEVVDLAAKAGVAAIEWGGDIHVPPGDLANAEAVRQLTIDAGLTVAAYGSYYSAAHTPAAEFDAVLATAVSLGAPTVRVWAGRGGSKDADARHVAAVTADLQRIADAASKAGLTITIEYHGGTLTDTLETTVALLDGIDRSNVLTGWQPRDGISMEAGVAEIRRLAPRLGNLHVFQWWPTGQTRHPLAGGGDRWPAFLAAAAEAGDREALLEFVIHDDPTQFLDDARTLNDWLAAIPA